MIFRVGVGLAQTAGGNEGKRQIARNQLGKLGQHLVHGQVERGVVFEGDLGEMACVDVHGGLPLALGKRLIK